MMGGGEDNTFLTDLMMGKKQQSEKKIKRPSSVRDQDSEMNDQDIEEELRDVVFDYENSHALVLAADDFLAGRGAYIGPEDQKSQASGQSTMSSRVRENKIL